MLLKFHVYGGS